MRERKNEGKKYKVPHLTEKGLKRLGLVINYWRVKRNMSLEAFCNEIEEKTGYRVSNATILNLEKGRQNPNFETINFIAYSGVVPYTTSQLFDFALEINIPKEIFEEEGV